MSRQLWLSGFVLVVLAIQGCVSPSVRNSQYKEAIDAYATGMSAAQTVLNADVAEQTRTKRLTAVQYYLKSPLDGVANFDNQNAEASFATFACIGVEKKLVTSEGLEYLRRYGQALQSVGKEPDDELGKIWENIERLRALREPIPYGKDAPVVVEPGKVPAVTVDDGPTAKCQALVLKLVRSPGMPARPRAKESLAGAIAFAEALKTLVSSVKAAAVHIAKKVDELERQKAFQEVVLGNSENVKQALDEANALSSEINESWEEARQASLLLPHALFIKMVSLNTVTQRDEIIELALKIDSSLSDFDKARTQPPPKAIFQAVAQAQKNLESIATDEATFRDSVAALKAFALELEALRDEVSTIKDAAKDLQDKAKI
jgi:hypothetical protein